MSQLKILARRIADLKTPSDLGKNLLKFNTAVIPCASMPLGYELIEGMTIAQVLSILQPKIDVPAVIPECICD